MTNRGEREGSRVDQEPLEDEVRSEGADDGDVIARGEQELAHDVTDGLQEGFGRADRLVGNVGRGRDSEEGGDTDTGAAKARYKR
jgi:hypothetical protein